MQRLDAGFGELLFVHGLVGGAEIHGAGLELADAAAEPMDW